MTIDPTKPVVLKKTIVTPSGSVIDARSTPYSAYEIPERFWTEEYLVQNVQVTENPVRYGDVLVDLSPISENRVKKTTHYKPTVVKREYKPLQEPTSLEIEEAEKQLEEKLALEKEHLDKVSRINVNTASIEEIASLKIPGAGIGKKTAKRVVEEREKDGLYKDCNDLNERVKIPFGDNWWKFQEKICF